MITNKTKGRIFTVCSLVLLWSFTFAAFALADQNQFGDNGDGTITDAKTGLTWQQEGLNGPFTWSQALGYVATLNTGQGLGECSGWVLPTSKELKRIVDHHKNFAGPALINTDYFPDTAADFYWSSSSHQNTLKYAISFGNGQQRKMSSSNTYYVRAVRGECDPADSDGDGYLPSEGDCNDSDPNINPSAVEVCDGNVDNNCDGYIDLTCLDVDNDGDGQTENEGDCDDRDPFNFAGNPEVCDGADNDCDTVADNGLNFDADLDGYYSTASCSYTGADDCNDVDANVHPGAAEECDTIDNNCDGSIDENLTRASTCGVGACAGNVGEETCALGIWGGDTCDPFAGATEETCDNVDNNCDGSVDENLTQATACGLGECSAAGIETCTAGSWGGDTCAAGAPAAEICDSLDNNCNGSIDENLTQVISCELPGACVNDTGVLSCIAGVWDNTCDSVTSATVEVCDTLDNDCDGIIDEGVTEVFYFDLDQDNYGTTDIAETACSPSPGFVPVHGDCNDNNNTVYPGAAEICGDGIDQSCSGADEACASLALLVGPDVYHDLIQNAYAVIAPAGTDTIKVRAIEYMESLYFDQNVTVTLAGGYDEFFSGLPTGYTIIAAVTGPTLTISNGTVFIENIILK